MWKKIRTALMIVLLLIFVGSGTMVGVLLHRYRESSRHFSEAAERYTAPGIRTDSQPIPDAAPGSSEAEAEPREYAPIRVDFDALCEVNDEIVGWIYCEGTVIDYPVLHAADNDYYLHRGYDRSSKFSGSIFVGADNSRGFTDANTIIYGHNMRDGSMFSTLEDWKKQEFYEEHPVMWLLTPTQDYRLDLFSGRSTSATSEAYQIFYEISEEYASYLKQAAAASDFESRITPDPEVRSVMLSTCAYIFDNARYVLHAQLTPVDSAGGSPLR